MGIRRGILGGTMAACACALGLSAPASAAPGDLDPSFGVGGRAQLTLEDGEGSVDVKVDSLGRPLVLTTTKGRAALLRFDEDGTLDETYAKDGKREFLSNEFRGDNEGVLALTPDDRALAIPKPFRLTSVDSTGRIEWRWEMPEQPYVVELAALDDGSVLLGGGGPSSGDDRDRYRAFWIQKRGPDGRVDRSFGQNSSVVTNFRQSYDSPSAIDTRSDGRIVAAGESDGYDRRHGDGVAIAQYLPDGTLDPGFSGDGRLVLGGEGRGHSIEFADATVDADDGILVFGYDEARAAAVVYRLLEDGTYDPSFGTGGLVALSPRMRHYDRDGGGIVPLRDGGALVLAGERIQRITAAGIVDRSFGGDDAFLRVPEAEFLGAAELPDGRIMAVSGGYGADDVGVFRLLAEPGPSDGDADGIGDEVDACPDAASENEDGCPRFQRRLHIRFSPKRDIFRAILQGKPRYDYNCSEVVEIVRRFRGTTFPVASDDSGWAYARRPHPLPGVYIARAPRSVRQDAICEALETPPIDVAGATDLVRAETTG